MVFDQLAYNKRYYVAHRDEIRAQHKRYYEAHKQERLAVNKKYHDAHRRQAYEFHRDWQHRNSDKRSISRKRYNDANRETINAKNREWNNEHRNERIAITHARRARIKGNGGTYTPCELAKLFDEQNGCCLYCGRLLYASFDRDVHIEHKIPISRGGSNNIENIALACSTCNGSKGMKTAEEFLEAIKS